MPVKSRAWVYTSAEAVSIPWSIGLMGAAITLASSAAAWDFAWHESIGRDTLFTPPHILMWTSAVLVGIACAYTIMATSFASASPARVFSLQVLGCHAPPGAFLAAW